MVLLLSCFFQEGRNNIPVSLRRLTYKLARINTLLMGLSHAKILGGWEVELKV